MEPPPGARGEPTFEIHAPLAVHRKNRRRRRALSDRSTLPPNLLDQPGTRQNVADRRKRRPIQFRRVQLQAKAKLLRTKMRKPMPQGHDPLYHRRFRPARNVPGRMRPILKPHRIAAQPTLPPQIKCLPTDAVALTQLRHAERPRVVVAQHLNPLFHRTGLSKRHRKPLPTTIHTCQPSSRFNLSGIYPVHTEGGHGVGSGDPRYVTGRSEECTTLALFQKAISGRNFAPPREHESGSTQRWNPCISSNWANAGAVRGATVEAAGGIDRCVGGVIDIIGRYPAE